MKTKSVRRMGMYTMFNYLEYCRSWIERYSVAIISLQSVSPLYYPEDLDLLIHKLHEEKKVWVDKYVEELLKKED
jgi:hypothetical protein